jgi:integrating conjugative element protein (TIGR03765 family)
MMFFESISSRWILGCLSALCVLAAQATEVTKVLIVVEDHGGASALPYYEALNLQPRPPSDAKPAFTRPAPAPLTDPRPVSEADMLPVRSAKLTPGTVERRVIEAPGLQAFFLVGDDAVSLAWLRRRATSLREHGAVGLVVNVATVEGLARLRAAAPGLTLAPVPADDLAERLGVRHYPVLITSTRIEP